MPKVFNKKPKEVLKNINIKLKEDEYKKLQELAKKENRNITNFITNCVKNYLEGKKG